MSDRQQVSASDIPKNSWVDRLPWQGVRPYLRLARMDRPIGTWLLLLPCWWSVALAAGQGPDVWLMAWFALGALVMRGAGCTLNDIADRDFDGKVARTAARPIPAGEVSVKQAFGFLGLQLALGFVILLQFNMFTVLLGIASLGLVAMYPFAKRVTYWPQLVLGLTFNWGALLGWSAVHGSLDWPPVLLYVAGVAWTLGYDTIYAHQDKDDDVVIGVKSTALKFGDRTRPWLMVFYGTTFAAFLAVGWMSGLNDAYYLAIAIVGGHMCWQIKTFDDRDSDRCLRLFKSNRNLGLIVFAGILLDKMMTHL